MTTTMQVETWPIDRLIPYDKNPRLNDDAVEAVARSIQEFGFRQPIVVDDEGVIIIGHTRLKAARKLRITEVPVHVARPLRTAEHGPSDRETRRTGRAGDAVFITDR